MKVTIKDVAKEANVAISTVSRVITNSGRISDETKKRVNTAIKKLNYTPNAIARKLVNKRSRILGVIIPKEAGEVFSNPFFVEAMMGISIVAEEKKYYLMYAFGKNEKDELRNVKEFSSNNLIDGICLLRVREEDSCIKYLQKIGFPFVVIGHPKEDRNILWVDNDNFKASYELVNKLIKEGHKKIAFIGGDKNLQVSKERRKGYVKALKENDLQINENLMMEEDFFTEESGYRAIEKILKNEMPSVVVTTEDLLAVGANKYLYIQGINHIRVTGFNNTPITRYQNPSISSVDINASKLGYEAGKMLINMLEGQEVLINYKIIETKFIER